VSHFTWLIVADANIQINNSNPSAYLIDWEGRFGLSCLYLTCLSQIYLICGEPCL
jgi:hypothetical protein